MLLVLPWIVIQILNVCRVLYCTIFSVRWKIKRIEYTLKVPKKIHRIPKYVVWYFQKSMYRNSIIYKYVSRSITTKWTVIQSAHVYSYKFSRVINALSRTKLKSQKQFSARTILSGTKSLAIAEESHRAHLSHSIVEDDSQPTESAELTI